MNDSPAARPSPMAQTAAGLGAGSVALCFFGCCCAALPMIGVPMGLAAFILGYLEQAKIKRGEIDAASAPWALAGMVLGAIGLVAGTIFLAILGLGAVSEDGVIDQFMAGFKSP